ncbi:hypothetical protein [uncultured Roseivirga sp.]|uniref:hypothetical protein n=1 Tax=uncultured Roseivirga sp. TaxID=543088 RepID=UPI0030D9B1EE
MDYLYDEISLEKKAQIDDYIKSHPEVKEELQALEATRIVMADLNDEEPESIPFIMPQTNSEWLYWRKYVAIAATILLIITAGWASGFSIQYNDDGLQMAFGDIQNGLTEQQVADIVNNDRQLMLNYMQAGLKSVQDSIGNEMQILQASMSSEEIIRKVFEQEKNTLMYQMASLNDKLGDNYREMLREIILNFSNNWDTQRIEDLRNIQAAFTNLEDATINKQLDLEDAILTLSEKVDIVAANNPNKK